MGAGLGFKTFVTGDVLTAADTNGYLMQGVWVFANAAARDAAVTSPQEGNFCYLNDTNATQYYTGSAWAAVGSGGGGALICVKAETSFSGSSAVVADSVFTSSYTNYKIIFNYTSSTNASVTMKLRAGGTATTSNYNYQFFEANGTGVTGNRSTSQSSFNISEWTNGSFNSTAIIEIENSQVATPTTIQAFGNVSLGAYTTPFIKNSFGNQSASTQFDGVEFGPTSGTITGSYTIYGYGKTL